MKEEKLLKKLRTPLHIDFISKNILKKSLEETRIILNNLIKSNIIKEENDFFFINKIK